MYNSGLDILPRGEPMGFSVGDSCFEHGTELRSLESIRSSLKNPSCVGPETVYAIMMDVGKKADLAYLKRKMLLFGVVTYAKGRLGDEPIRSQGHIHKVSAHCGWSTPEVYEIWSGSAYIYMQEKPGDDPGKCYAVYAKPGDVVVVPPYWVHATISADMSESLTFGAWCDRDYGFEYEDVRNHGGIAWFPMLKADGTVYWAANSQYHHSSELIKKTPESYIELGLENGVPIYTQFEQDNERFLFVSEPARVEKQWENFVP